MNIYYVYKHTFPNGCIYIGKGKGKRAYAFDKRDTSPYWKHTYQKYKIVCVEILAEGLSDADAYKLEETTIREYLTKGFQLGKELINLTRGGEGFKTFHTLESRLKMSKSQLGNTNRKGTTTSKEGIENIRKGQLGKKRTPEAIAKTANALKGRKRPVEVCEKLRKANLGKTHSTQTKQKLSEINKDKTVYTFLNKNTLKEETMTTYELGLKYGILTASLRGIVTGIRKSCYGWQLKE